MKNKLTLIVILIAAVQIAASAWDGTSSSMFRGKVNYDKCFTNDRLRVDLVFAGNKDRQQIYLSGMHRESEWSGSPNSLIDKFGYGQYYLELFEGRKLIYSKGFCTLFDEWTTTNEAKTISRATTQSVWMPFPKNEVKLVIYQRGRKNGRFHNIFECRIDPKDRHITGGPENKFNVISLLYNGDSQHKVDLAIAGEAYTKDDIEKLRADANRMIDYMFAMEPYSSRKNDFNVWLVESISEDGHPDIPQSGQWGSTVFESGFDTFYEDRYLTVWDHSKIGSVFSGTPFDTVMILVNDEKYGGGGFFNSYAVTSTDNERSLPVFVHEFGHSFAGLADEYYGSSVAFEDFYDLRIEPWEPNITTLVKFNDKWKDMVDADTPIPTPADSLKYVGKVGAFEGAGYMTHGCYRPVHECRMLNNTAPGFCPVCQRAINRMIDYYVQ